MLPQFGFIVAQAGADSHPPTPNNNTPPATSSTSSSAAPTPQLTKPYIPPPPSNSQQPNQHPQSQGDYYYTRPSPPASNSSSTHSMLPPPPPLPYMYSSGPPPPMTRDEYYSNRYQPPFDARNDQYRSLQPLPPPPPHPPSSWQDGSYMDAYHSSTWQQPHQQPQAPSYSMMQTPPSHLHVPPPPPSTLPPPPAGSVQSYQQYPPPPQQPQQQGPPLSVPAPPSQAHHHANITNSNTNHTIPTPPTVHHGSTKSVVQPPLPSQSQAKLQQHDDYIYEDQSHGQQHHHWQERIEENKMLRRIREFNDLMTWMDSEFWEQCDEVYREKLQSLQEEIRTIQEGTHSAFTETMTDIETRREQTIYHAEFYKNYELSLTKHQYDQEIYLIRNEFETERHNLHDLVLQAIEDRKKQVKEDKEDYEFDVQDLFKDAYARMNTKRNLRKRTQFDRHNSASPSRQERRKRERQATPHNIHAQPSTAEEEELESEFLNMKGGTAARRQAAQISSSQQRR
ncbi:Sds3-like-domain-containing protein [Parasitella parasitica]|nr:Sds3-like-domain-containing protein [Parasitella parasitica]